ncbi:hypothetical protein QR680_009223 [Steinernema hermaphroditum]|uniref:SH2 domain-containing protein n=1 Tax=Steinernema hermaphroditum TaxID=289476 RepID=A0AA39ILA2_9BILA|nr:hypothetical protein QR680_009223 [Steinernema hermaphroditum]
MQDGGAGEYAAGESSADESAFWFHGYIGHREAENRLLGFGREGAFLIQSRHDDSNLYLSYLHNASVFHLPITVICGHFFLADRQFPSLTALVCYFSKSPQSPLQEPLAPPHEIVRKHRRRIAVLPYKALKGTDELGLRKGDLLVELQEVGDDWIWATLEGRKDSGLVPVALTALLDEVADPSQLPYFHEGEPLALAQCLVRAGKNSFLLRRASDGTNFVILVNSGPRIAKVLVECRPEGGYLVGGRIFTLISDIVRRYGRTEICDGCLLHYPHLRDSASDYAELKVASLTRMGSHSSCPQPIASVSALMKTREWKKWKNCFVMLSDANGSQLYLFDSTSRTKPRLVVNLCFCTVLRLDESVLLRDDCVQLVIHGIEATSLFLAFPRRSAFFQWFGHLKTRCLGLRNPNALFLPFSSPKTAAFKAFSFLHVALHSFRSATLKPNVSYVASVHVNGFKLGSSKCRSVSGNSAQVVFDVAFFLEWIPIPHEAASCSLQLVLHTVAGHKKPRLVDSSPLYSLDDPDSEGPRLKETGVDGGFAFDAQRFRITVLPVSHYSSFHALLSVHEFVLCQWTFDALCPLERTVFCRSLVAVFLPELATLVRLVATVVDAHLASTPVEVLFRADSFCTALISQALRTIAFGALKERLAGVLASIADGPDEPEAQITEFLDELKAAVPKLPPAFIAVMSTVADRMTLAFPGNLQLRRRSVSTFFFLRLVNPIALFFEASAVGAANLCQFVRSIQKTLNLATSKRYSPTTASDSVRVLVDVLDVVSVQTSQQKGFVLRNEFWNYSRADYLALLHFFVASTLLHGDSNNNVGLLEGASERGQCPLAETAHVVLHLLQKHAEHVFAGGAVSP